MNNNILEYAKDSGFYVAGNHIHASYEHPRYGEICVEITKELTKLAELVQANSASDAEAKLKIAVRALKDLLGDTQHKDHVCNTKYCPVAQAKQALEKIGE